MSKQDTLGLIMQVNGCEIPTQKDFNEFVLEPLRTYPFDSNIVTSYMITRTKDGEKLQITPENLWKQLTKLTDEFKHFNPKEKHE